MLRRLVIIAALTASFGRTAEPPVFALPEEAPRLTPDEAARVQRYLNYPSLPRLNETRIEMPAALSASCMGAPPSGAGPHGNAAVNVYVNDRAIEKAAQWSAASRFPIGTLLVKEKFENPADPAPSLITVMEKVADQGKVEDWLFYLIQLPHVAIVRTRAAVSCKDCHSLYSGTDFVSPTTFSLLSSYAKRQASPATTSALHP